MKMSSKIKSSEHPWFIKHITDKLVRLRNWPGNDNLWKVLHEAWRRTQNCVKSGFLEAKLEWLKTFA